MPWAYSPSRPRAAWHSPSDPSGCAWTRRNPRPRARLRARLVDRAYFGGETELAFAGADGTAILARRPSTETEDWPPGAELWLSWRIEDCIPLVG